MFENVLQRVGDCAALLEAVDHYAESKRLLRGRWGLAKLRHAGIKAMEKETSMPIKFPDLVEEFVAFQANLPVGSINSMPIKRDCSGWRNYAKGCRPCAKNKPPPAYGPSKFPSQPG